MLTCRIYCDIFTTVCYWHGNVSPLSVTTSFWVVVMLFSYCFPAADFEDMWAELIQLFEDFLFTNRYITLFICIYICCLCVLCVP